MQAPTVFFSWQSDTTRRFNKNLIETALVKATTSVSNELGLSAGMIVDRDTQGVSGSPSIPETIFQKIDSCAVFVADLTLVGQAWARKVDQKPEELQRFPNANVILELGYAVKSIGWRRVIGVLNSAGDKKPDKSIFHLLQHRWPIEYELSDKSQAAKIEAGLTADLSKAIGKALAEQHAAAETALQKLNIECLQFMQFVKKIDYFSHDTVKAIGNADAARNFQQLLSVATNRLLDLGIIFTHVDSKSSSYAYHWTYVGDLVRRRV